MGLSWPTLRRRTACHRTLWQWELLARTLHSPCFSHLSRTEKGSQVSYTPQGFSPASFFLQLGSATQRLYSLPKLCRQLCGPSVHTRDLWGTSHTQTGVVLKKLRGHSFSGGTREPSESIQKARLSSSYLQVSSISLTVALSNPILPL